MSYALLSHNLVIVEDLVDAATGAAPAEVTEAKAWVLDSNRAEIDGSEIDLEEDETSGGRWVGTLPPTLGLTTSRTYYLKTRIVADGLSRTKVVPLATTQS